MTPLDLEAVTYPCRLVYRFTAGTTTRLAVADVNHVGMVEVSTHIHAELEGRPAPAEPEGATVSLDWRTVHELVTAHGGELIEIAPW